MRDCANQIAQMFVGWQITIIDLPRLLEIGSGKIVINLLTGVSSIDGALCEPFTIADVVHGWLDDARDRDSLPAEFIHRVFISCDFDVSEGPTPQGAERHVRIYSPVVGDAENGEWSGSSRKSELWEKVGTAPWEVMDV